MKTVFDVIANDRASAKLGRIGQAFRGMAGNSRRAQAEMRGASAGMRGMFGGMRSGFEMMAVGGGMLKLGGGLVSSLGGAEKIAGEFEYRMSAVGMVSKASAQELKMLGAAAKQAGIDTQYTPIQAAEALQTLAQAGFNAKQSMDTLRPSLDLAAGSAGQLDVAESASVIQQAIKGYGVAMEDSSLATDQLLRSTQMFSINAKDLPLGLGNTARGAQTMNQGLEESLITFGLIRNVIPRVATASMAAGISMERMADPKVQAKLKSMHVAVADGEGKFRNYLDIVTDLMPQLNKMSETERGAFLQKTFGMEGSRGILAIMQQLNKGIPTTTGEVLKGAEAIAYYRNEIGKAKGTAADLREALLGTSEGQKKLLEGSKQTAAISIGGALAGLFKPIVKAEIGTINTFIEAFDALPPIAQQITVGFTGVAGVFIKMLGATILLGGAMRMLGISFTGLLMTIGKVLLISVPLMGFIGALGVGFYGLYRASQKNVGGMGDTFSGLWSKVKLGFRATIDLIKGGGLSEAVKEDLKKAENQGVGKFITWITEKIGIAKAFFGGLVSGFDRGLERLAVPFEKVKKELLGFMGIFSTDGENVQSKLDGWEKSGESLGDRFADLALFAMKFVTKGLRMVKSAFEDITMKDVEKGLSNILSLFQAMATAVETIAKGARAVSQVFTMFGAAGLSEKEMTSKQMLSFYDYAAEGDMKGVLGRYFDVYDEQLEKGIIDRGTARGLKEKTFSQLSSMQVLEERGWTGNTGVADKTQEKMLKSLQAMERKMDVMAGRTPVIKIGEEQFGEVVDAATGRKQERDYTEDWPTVFAEE